MSRCTISATQKHGQQQSEIAKKELSNKDCSLQMHSAGANKDNGMAIRFIVEVAWQATPS